MITGSVQVEGGDARQTKRTRAGRVEQRTIAPDRRAANVISTGYARRLRRLCLLRTPWGALVEVERLQVVKELIAGADVDVQAFNSAHAGARLTNALLWEHLRGNRLAAVEAWAARTGAPELQNPSA